jgi:starch synthase (maltosyl-transferring)
MSGRYAITDISPAVLSGRRPAAAAVGELIAVQATCFREGHDALGAHVVLRDPQGSVRQRVRMQPLGQDRWMGAVRPDAMGPWTFEVEAWGDPWSTWQHRAGIKIPAAVDVELEFEEGAILLERAAALLPGSMVDERERLTVAARTLLSTELPDPVRLAAGFDPQVARLMHEHPIREFVTVSGPWPLSVQRRRALVGAWYEMFPRSEGASADPPRSGTFATAAERLPAIAAMGFDVVYLPPVHPIGYVNRKGPNNTLTPGPADPGCPWAIGSAEGGHDAIHPDLGTMASFDAFVRRLGELGMEVALDLALQAAPDHPWVRAHPEWFTTRADGSIAYAENPPKKYQDIYPLNFDIDPEGLYAEIERVVRFWVSHGVRIFRVDNPHTKPLWAWERLIAAINSTHPDVLFLAEAFTKPHMMKALAEIGFQQSYTYFTWRNTREEVESYLTELAGPAAAYMRPNFFANTPDILPEYLQHGGPNAFAIRAVLAATLSPSYGIYSGFELFEHVSLRPGSEEYLDSEKYQYRPRDWAAADASGLTLAPLLTRLNAIRREHPALQDLRSVRFHDCDNSNIIAFSKRDGDDIILVACTVDPYREQQATIRWDMPEIGLTGDDKFVAHDLISGRTWTWSQGTYVRLNPAEQIAHVVHVVPV